MLVKASFSQEVTTSGNSMVFIPEGIHTITPTVNGKPKEITVRVKAHQGRAIAEKIQASFEDRKKSNKIPAIFDFDHKDTGPASAHPKKFFYEEGKGIMVERELTGAGSKAIKAKDYSYFSPVFNIGKDGVPSGVPERGPLGALVNDPAFRDIPRIAAKDAANQNTTTMDDLVTCGLLTPNEAAKPNAGEIAKQRVSAMNGDTGKVAELNKQIAELKAQKAKLEGKVEASEASVKKAKEDNANSLVQAAVAAGKIAPKDKDTQEYWVTSIMASDQAAKILETLPKKHEGITKQKVQASASNQTNTSEHGLIEAANALVASGQCKTQDEAITVAASANPELYDSYNESITQ